jgi:enoyl-CoA hydratase/carnithine racemase
VAEVTLDRQGPIATLTLNRPDRRNSLSDPLLRDLLAALGELRDDPESRVVVLTGADPVFSAGADAPGMKAAMAPEERRRVFLSRRSEFRRLFERVTTLLEELEQVTIASVNGHAVGGGWGLILACDFRIASSEALFWIPEVDLGVPLGVASTARFVRLAGEARAREIILTGRRYSAAEAKALGLVHEVVARSHLAGATREYAERLAAKPFGPLAQVKANINAIGRTSTPAVLAVTEGFLRRHT